jgi:hypothetical protein
MGLRGGRGAPVVHGEASSELPLFRGGCRRMRCWRDWYASLNLLLS